MNILLRHGGLFKATGAGQRFMAAATGVPVFVTETIDEDDSWGMMLLAAYLMNREPQENPEKYLERKMFAGSKGSSITPDPKDAKGFEAFLKCYKQGLSIGRAVVEYLKQKRGVIDEIKRI